MKYFYLLLLLPCLFFQLKAESVKELESKLPLTKGVPRIQILNSLVDELLEIDPQRSLQYANQAVSESKKLNNKAELQNSYKYLSFAYRQLGDFHKSINAIKESISLLDEKKDKESLSDCYNLLAILYKRKNDPRLAIETFQKALYFAKDAKLVEQEADILNNIGNSYDYIGEYENAINFFLKSLKIRSQKAANEDFDKENLGILHSNIGKIYYKMQSYSQAKENLERALLYFDKDDKSKFKSIVLNNLGLVNFELKNFNKALDYYNKALHIKQILNDKNGVASIYNNLGLMYKKQSEYSLALNNFQNAFKIYQELNSVSGFAIIYLNLADLNLMNRNLPMVKENLDKAQIIIDSNNFSFLKLEYYDKYGEYFRQKGNIMKAMEYKDKYVALKDSMLNTEKTKKINDLFSRFYSEESERRLENIRRESQLQELEIQAKKAQNIFLLVAIALLSTTIVIAVNRIRLKNRFEAKLMETNDELNKANDELNKANENLNKANDELNKANDELNKAKEEIHIAYTKEKELNDMKSNLVSMISHEYRTPLTVINSSSDILKHYANLGDLNQIDKQTDRIKTTVLGMNKMLDQFLAFTKGEAKKLNTNPEKVNLCNFLNDLVNNYFINIDQGQHNINLGCQDDSLMINIDLLALNHIFSNLISNALKYSPEGSNIEILIDNQVNNISCTVKDYGIGIPKTEQKYLFETFHRFSNAKTIKGTGLGMSIVKKIVDEIGGTIIIDSEENIGTSITFTLPKDKVLAA